VSSVTARAPAKINLCLAVGAPRGDGYHPLATVFHAVSLFDHLTAAPADDGTLTLDLAPGGDEDAATLAGVPADERNLAVRAARLLAERTGTTRGAHLSLRKTIPAAGGLAGGSTDAAAALVACDALWQTGLAPEDLQGLAAELGSDVPFCLTGGTAIGSGRGEVLNPVLAAGSYHWVLAVADRGLSTPEVYAEVDRLRAGSDVPAPDVPDDLLDALRAGDAAALGRLLANDLQPAAMALRPELADLLALAEACGALGAVVSGSGPTCCFLVNDDAHALDVGVSLASAGSCRWVHRVTGPVPGAQVVDGDGRLARGAR
jgi:4-diphosphocytidyl-2-C-methyl-D-erythritol kinase